MLLSLCEAMPECPLQAYVLHDGSLSRDDRAALTRTLGDAGSKVEFPQLDLDWLGQFPTKGPLAGERISWARLALPSLLPDVRRLLYLDADTFVCESLSPLFSLDLEGSIVGAVRNVIQPAMYGHVADIGIHDPRTYFNAGVLLIDMDQMREQEIVEGISEYVATHGSRLFWFDQDALNVALAGRWKVLHPRWNTQNSYWTWAQWAEDLFGTEELNEARCAPAILHFEGPDPYKPWHILSPHPFTAQYRANLALTPWADEALTGKSRSGRLIAQLPAPWQVAAYRRWETARSATRARVGHLAHRLRRP
jgi:lipopolysaccharide biosynthesis glycosyltransferase